jgi:hypothetical protein
MSDVQRTKLRDTLGIIAACLTILLNAGVIFGGMQWIANVNTQLATIGNNQKWVLTKIEEITKWEHEHELTAVQHVASLNQMSDKVKELEKKIGK